MNFWNPCYIYPETIIWSNWFIRIRYEWEIFYKDSPTFKLKRGPCHWLNSHKTQDRRSDLVKHVKEVVI